MVTMLLLLVVTGCKKETYGDPMKFAQKYLLEELDSPQFRILDNFCFATKMPFTELLKQQGYMGFEILSARLGGNLLGDECVECTVKINTSGKYKYYKPCSERDISYSFRHVAKLSGGTEKWVRRLRKIVEEDYPKSYIPITMPLTFTASVARRQVDGTYVPVCSSSRNGRTTEHEKRNLFWKFSDDACFMTNYVVTSEQIKNIPHWFVDGSLEQANGYSCYSQCVVRVKELVEKIYKYEQNLDYVQWKLGEGPRGVGYRTYSASSDLPCYRLQKDLDDRIEQKDKRLPWLNMRLSWNSTRLENSRLRIREIEQHIQEEDQQSQRRFNWSAELKKEQERFKELTNKKNSYEQEKAILEQKCSAQSIEQLEEELKRQLLVDKKDILTTLEELKALALTL